MFQVIRNGTAGNSLSNDEHGNNVQADGMDIKTSSFYLLYISSTNNIFL